MNAKNIAVALGAALAPSLASAATITVNSLADAAVPVADTQCTLREALMNANTNAMTSPDCVAGSGSDEIHFSVTGTIVQAAGTTFDIIDNIRITGPGAALLTIDGEDTNPAGTFVVGPAATALNVSFDNLTIANGNGSAIHVSQTPAFNLAYSVITGNNAAQGGALYLYAIVGASISDSVISGNTATRGGGIWAYDIGPLALTVANSEVSGNVATNAGGGAFILDANFLITNSTIANNSAATIGGGVADAGTSIGTIEFSTLSGNTAGTQGGNITVGLNAADLQLDHTIVANGTAPIGPDIRTNAPADVNAVWSLIEDPSGANILGSNNLIGIDPQDFRPLQNNGGRTGTMLPLPGSPVVNGGDPAFVPPPGTDQRGRPRIVGRVDIGAVELRPAELIGLADLNVTKTVIGSGPFAIGQTATFNIVVTNSGPDAAPNVTLTDILPAGTVFVAATPSSGSCSGTTTVTCNVGTLADDGSASVQLTVRLTQAGSVENIATATSDANDETPAAGSTTIVVLAEVDAIPTLSEWLLTALAAAMAAAAALRLRQ